MARNFFEKNHYNEIVLETDNFIVVPSLGSLITGWLLIVPKNFYINFSQLSEGEIGDLNELIKKVENDILPIFGSEYVLFEHGPINVLSKAGCGVDYAHLHFVPCEFNLKLGLNKYLNLDYSWTSLSQLGDITKFKDKESEYLLLKDQAGNFSITFQNEVQSQTFRKVIANYLNAPNDYDWKKDHRLDVVNSTLEKIRFQLA
jgi:ATP adenylyltransferase